MLSASQRRGHRMRLLSCLLTFICLFGFNEAFAQRVIKLTGRVTDEQGQAIPRASIQVKGTNTGTIANSQGYFEISAPANAVLVASSVGYATQEKEINNQSVIDFILVKTASDEDAVVVIGYGNQRKEAVTGSVASISGKALTEVPAANISQSLQGRLPGIELSQTSSRPGATMQIRIRGTRSLNASNDPLIVLDGIPFAGSIADINTNDVKSIDILKDEI